MQTETAILAHLPVSAITALAMEYVWKAPHLVDAHHAEFWEACYALTNASNANTSLQYACAAGNEGIVRMIIAKGAHELESGLNMAAIHGRTTVVDLLLGEGGVKYIRVALTNASQNGHLSTVQRLLQFRDRAQGSLDYEDALGRACMRGHAHVARALLAIHNPHPHEWQSVVRIAYTYGHVDLARMCVEPQHYHRMSREAWVSCAVAAEQKGHPEIADIITAAFPEAD
jgi:hypothetical protein